MKLYVHAYSLSIFFLSAVTAEEVFPVYFESDPDKNTHTVHKYRPCNVGVNYLHDKMIKIKVGVLAAH